MIEVKPSKNFTLAFIENGVSVYNKILKQEIFEIIFRLAKNSLMFIFILINVSTARTGDYRETVLLSLITYQHCYAIGQGRTSWRLSSILLHMNIALLLLLSQKRKLLYVYL